MKRSLISALLVLSVSGMLKVFPAVECLIQRRLPAHAGQIILKDRHASAPGDVEVFAYETRDGKRVLEGNTPLAQSVVLREYLRKVDHIATSWEGLECDGCLQRYPLSVNALSRQSLMPRAPISITVHCLIPAYSGTENAGNMR